MQRCLSHNQREPNKTGYQSHSVNYHYGTVGTLYCVMVHPPPSGSVYLMLSCNFPVCVLISSLPSYASKAEPEQEQRSLGLEAKFSGNQRNQDKSWQLHSSSGLRNFLFKIKIPDDPNIGKRAPAEHLAFCAESRKEAEITIEATRLLSSQPRGLYANCLPQQ